MASKDNTDLVRYDGSDLDAHGLQRVLSIAGMKPATVGFGFAVADVCMRSQSISDFAHRTALGLILNVALIVGLRSLLDRKQWPKDAEGNWINLHNLVIDKSGIRQTNYKIAQALDRNTLSMFVSDGLASFALICICVGSRKLALLPVVAYAVGRTLWNYKRNCALNGETASSEFAEPERWSVQLRKPLATSAPN